MVKILPFFLGLYLPLRSTEAQASTGSSYAPRYPNPFNPGLYNPANNYSCVSSAPSANPIVLLHGLGAAYFDDIQNLQSYLDGLGYCTYSFTYGTEDGDDYVGGLQHIAASAPSIASFIQTVYNNTGASNKVNVVGHSEGAMQTLYVPKFEGVASIIDKLVAIAPPTHGTTASGSYNASVLFTGNPAAAGSALDSFGCGACADMLPDGAAVQRLNDGSPIVQQGNSLTVILSRNDEGVTPEPQAGQVLESGVNNWIVQNYCPTDRVGHVGETYDPNVMQLVRQALQGETPGGFDCVFSGYPS